jgi:putative transposase
MHEVRDGHFTLRLPLPALDILARARDLLQRSAQAFGLLLAQAIMEEEVQRLLANERIHRWGYEEGSIVYGGQKMPVRRPRLRRGRREVPLQSYRLLGRDEQLQESVHGQVLRGVSTRDYQAGAAGLPAGHGAERSSISRRFVRVSSKELAKLCERSLRHLRLAVLVIDGKSYRQQTIVVALGIDEKGRKHVLGLWDGGTENAAVCQGLLDDLLRRGLDPRTLDLCLIDGAKALRVAIKRTFGEAMPVQRCQVHKKRNVLDHLPPKWQGAAGRRISAAYGMNSYAEARGALRQIVKWLRTLSEGAARSLEEGLEETITLHRLGVPPLLRDSLSSTNVIESCFSRVEHLTRNVKRWRPGQMVRRWVAATLLHAEKKFHRIHGHQAMPLLLVALASHKKGTSKAVTA